MGSRDVRVQEREICMLHESVCERAWHGEEDTDAKEVKDEDEEICGNECMLQ